MRNFKAIGDRFYTPANIIGGPRTRLVIHPPTDSDSPSNTFLTPHFMGRAPLDTLARPGQVVYVPSHNQRYLLARHSSDADHVTFYMFMCERQVIWRRTKKVIDLVTQLPRGDGEPVVLGTFWSMWQRERREFTDLNMRVTQERYIVLTGEDVQIRDTLDGKFIDRIDEVYGVKVLELQG